MTLYRISEDYSEQRRYRVEAADRRELFCYVRPADPGSFALVRDQVNEVAPTVPLYHAVQLTGQLWLKIIPGGFQLFQAYPAEN